MHQNINNKKTIYKQLKYWLSDFIKKSKKMRSNVMMY